MPGMNVTHITKIIGFQLILIDYFTLKKIQLTAIITNWLFKWIEHLKNSKNTFLKLL